jgi:hypothetical protein
MGSIYKYGSLEVNKVYFKDCNSISDEGAGFRTSDWSNA